MRSCYLQRRSRYEKICHTIWGILSILAVLALTWLTVASPAAAQKKDKNKNKNAPATDPVGEIRSSMHVPDSQAIDQAIGEALGYWQIGDVVIPSQILRGRRGDGKRRVGTAARWVG